MSNTSKLLWNSPIEELYKGKKLPKSISLLKEANIHTLRDLSWIFPTKFYHVHKNPYPESTNDGDYVRVNGFLKNIKTRPIFRKRMRFFQVSGTLETQNGDFSLIWFNTYPNLKEKIENYFSESTVVTLEGTVSTNGPWTQIANPTFKQQGDDTVLTYPTVNKVRGSFIEKMIQKIPHELWEELPELKFHQVSLAQSLKSLHQIGDISYNDDYIDRIKYEEFFLEQLKIALRKDSKEEQSQPPLKFSKKLLEKSLDIFPYPLTVDQKLCFDEIIKDLESTYPLSRLVQGDVGCGKTSVAILAMKAVYELGFQVAFMAPTENLSYQHFQNLINYFPEEKIAFLSSSVSAKEKKIIYQKIKENEARVIIGTHSLFQDKLEYHNLRLTIIDEQHKFGVDQRIQFLNKCTVPNCLLMSATPIPRTLSLTQYGDLDISIIKEMPAHKKGFKTRIVNSENMSKFLSFLKTRLDLNEQAYVVLPNIDKTEFRSTYSIEEVHEQYKKFFPETNIAILHGRLDSDEQKSIIHDFRENKIQLLISTTVVEVGIHVSNATLMIIYHPEYFGLSSLHQLRGRVGRDKLQGFCFLIITNKLGPQQNQRLSFFEKENDGFKIAEEDLLYRGEGNLFGKTQSGASNSRKISNLLEDIVIFNKVIEDFKDFNKSDFLNHIHFYNLKEDKYIGHLI